MGRTLCAAGALPLLSPPPWDRGQEQSGLGGQLSPTHCSLHCLVLGSWLQRPAWDRGGEKGRALSNLLSLVAAPASAPQNLHAIRTDSGLILEWEEVIPEGPSESPLGPYKLYWVQDNNGTQVREDQSL